MSTILMVLAFWEGAGSVIYWREVLGCRRRYWAFAIALWPLGAFCWPAILLDVP